MNMDQLCVLAVWFTNALILGVLIFIINKFNKNLKEKTDYEQLKFNLEYEPKDTDFQIIDALIKENLDAYKILKLESVDKLYITQQIQENIFEYVLRQVLYQISPMYMQRLYFIYNKDKIDEVITQKINLHILDYTIEVNGNIRK